MRHRKKKGLIFAAQVRTEFDIRHATKIEFCAHDRGSTIWPGLPASESTRRGCPDAAGKYRGRAGRLAGMYVMLIHFFGYQITLNSNGPAGTTTAFRSSNTSTAVAMLFTGSGGTATGFSFACTGIYLGFVQSIQVFPTIEAGRPGLPPRPEPVGSGRSANAPPHIPASHYRELARMCEKRADRPNRASQSDTLVDPIDPIRPLAQSPWIGI